MVAFSRQCRILGKGIEPLFQSLLVKIVNDIESICSNNGTFCYPCNLTAVIALRDAIGGIT